jgi:diacylglycerol kinase (ATP)
MNPFNRLAFVLNPKSGAGKSTKIYHHLYLLEHAGKTIEVFEWKKADEIDALLNSVLQWQPDAIIAVGGDGTVNFLGSFLINKNIPLGIIPCGSGNGLARHLGISMNMESAVKKLITAKEIKIDAGKINEHYFFCTAGLGYDALVANRFSLLKKRGLIGYAKESLLSLKHFKPENFRLYFNQTDYEFNAVILTFANAAQFGNNAYIAPRADLMDGKLDLTVIEKISPLRIPILAYKLFKKNIHQDSSVRTFSSNEFRIVRKNDGFLHFDGETARSAQEIIISVIPAALNVLI